MKLYFSIAFVLVLIAASVGQQVVARAVAASVELSKRMPN